MSSRWPPLLSLLALGAAGFLPAADRPAVADGDVKAFVDRRVEEWQPTAEERRFDEVGWCTSLVEARRLAKEHKRPVFLFTHDGKMNVGRC
jgi:hypothetical protein